jgi:ADP-ribose pyrophosphatase YjhB (NUDIX family)
VLRGALVGLVTCGDMASRTILEVSRELASIAQAGITYSADPYDRERFLRLHEIASEVMRTGHADFEWPTELGYATPKVDVRGAVFRNGEILLIKEASSGKWTLPGGWADVNLTPAENVEKEILEESGYEAKARLVTAIVDRDRAGYPANPHSIYKIFFLCDLRGGAPRVSHETSDIAFFPLDALPELDPDRTSALDIDGAWRSFLDPSLPTRFN